MNSQNIVLQIAIDPQSVLALNKSGQVLLAFKAVKNSDKATRPLLWARGDMVSSNNTLTIGPLVNVYTSTQTEVVSGTPVPVSFDTAAKPGDILDVKPNMGDGGTISGGGQPGIFTFQNSTSQGLLCGLEQEIDGKASQYCAAPLHGQAIESFSPVEKILLGFATTQVQPGAFVPTLTWAEQIESMVSISALVMVDVTGATSRSLKFNINQGWDWGGASWATGYPGNSDLTSILVLG